MSPSAFGKSPEFHTLNFILLNVSAALLIHVEKAVGQGRRSSTRTVQVRQGLAVFWAQPKWRLALTLAGTAGVYTVHFRLPGPLHYLAIYTANGESSDIHRPVHLSELETQWLNQPKRTLFRTEWKGKLIRPEIRESKWKFRDRCKMVLIRIKGTSYLKLFIWSMAFLICSPHFYSSWT